MNRLYDHFRGVLPRLGSQFHALQCVSRNATHAAVNIGKGAPVKHIQYPCSQRIPEVPMEGRHCALLDRAFEPGPHDVFRSTTELFYKGFKLTEIVGEIGISKDSIFTTNIRDGINIRTTQSSPRSF